MVPFNDEEIMYENQLLLFLATTTNHILSMTDKLNDDWFQNWRANLPILHNANFTCRYVYFDLIRLTRSKFFYKSILFIN